jgi:hypothetical protein
MQSRYRAFRSHSRNSLAFSSQANCTDLSTATGLRNLVPTFTDRGLSRGQRGGSPTVVNLSFLGRIRYLSFKQLLIYAHKAMWTPFRTHCYSENLVAPGIEPGKSATRPQRRSCHNIGYDVGDSPGVFISLYFRILMTVPGIMMIHSVKHPVVADMSITTGIWISQQQFLCRQ